MPASGAEPNGFEDEHLENVEEVEEPEEPDEEELEEESEAESEAESTDDEEDGDGSASLDELLAQRAAARRATDEESDDGDEILALVSERDEPVRDSINTRVIPIKDRQEFVCKRCHLVKAKSQLADPQRGLCRDCV